MENMQIFDYDDYLECSLHGNSFLIDKEDNEILKGKRWRISQQGYVCYGHQGLLHRLLMNPGKGWVVDHINGNPLDCRKENLRIITQKQNSYNARIGKNNKSGYKGVSWHKEKGKFCACICVDGRTKHLGAFYSVKEAAVAYNLAASFYFGEYAKLNEIGGS